MTNDTPVIRNKNNKCSGPYLLCNDPPHYITPVELSDIPEVVRVLNINKDVYYGTGSFEYPHLESHARARIEARITGNNETGYTACWAMRTSPEGPLMGWIHAHFLPPGSATHPETGRDLKIGVIGYWVSPEHVRRGYGSRSAKFIVHEILFKERGCDIVRAVAYRDNIASRRVLEAAGMRCEVEEKVVFSNKLGKEMVDSCYAVHRDSSTLSVITPN
ncbi:acyl-CoA N-acyltransferase [Linnemannia elongata]|nr:acyl-CoA N-acyltransferase [Linnemannia elongata]